MRLDARFDDALQFGAERHRGREDFESVVAVAIGSAEDGASLQGRGDDVTEGAGCPRRGRRGMQSSTAQQRPLGGLLEDSRGWCRSSGGKM